MDFIYSDALFSIMRASSNSRTISTMHGLYVEYGSRHCSATSTTLHIASAWYPPFMPGSTISSTFDALMYGFACMQSYFLVPIKYNHIGLKIIITGKKGDLDHTHSTKLHSVRGLFMLRGSRPLTISSRTTPKLNTSLFSDNCWVL